jgi:hypothetical protein
MGPGVRRDDEWRWCDELRPDDERRESLLTLPHF